MPSVVTVIAVDVERSRRAGGVSSFIFTWALYCFALLDDFARLFPAVAAVLRLPEVVGASRQTAASAYRKLSTHYRQFTQKNSTRKRVEKTNIKRLVVHKHRKHTGTQDHTTSRSYIVRKNGRQRIRRVSQNIGYVSVAPENRITLLYVSKWYNYAHKSRKCVHKNSFIRIGRHACRYSVTCMLANRTITMCIVCYVYSTCILHRNLRHERHTHRMFRGFRVLA